MKGKISATVDEPLLDFLDSLPGKTRSEKLERVLVRFKRIVEDQRLRDLLADHPEPEGERHETDAWDRTFDEAMWRE